MPNGPGTRPGQVRGLATPLQAPEQPTLWLLNADRVGGNGSSCRACLPGSRRRLPIADHTEAAGVSGWRGTTGDGCREVQLARSTGPTSTADRHVPGRAGCDRRSARTCRVVDALSLRRRGTCRPLRTSCANCSSGTLRSGGTLGTGGTYGSSSSGYAGSPGSTSSAGGSSRSLRTRVALNSCVP